MQEEGQQQDDKTRYMAILAALTGCQGIDTFRELCQEAMREALTPVELKEIVYQSVDYLGIGKL